MAAHDVLTRAPEIPAAYAAWEHRDNLRAEVRRAFFRIAPDPMPIPLPHIAGAAPAKAGCFAHTGSLDDAAFHRALTHIAWGVTPDGDFDEARGHYLLACGRDFRKYGLGARHYAALAEAFASAIPQALPHLDLEKKESLIDTAELACNLLATGAQEMEDEGTPAAVAMRVVEVQRVPDALGDVAIIRGQMQTPLAYWPGQHIELRTPHSSDVWRPYSPAVPWNEDGIIEFHIKAHGKNSRAIVEHAEPGEQWVAANPYGELGILGGDPGSASRAQVPSVVMVAGSTGLAPMRAMILDCATWSQPPKVTLYYGARTVRGLYDVETMMNLARVWEWLQVVPVVEDMPAPGEATIPGLRCGLVGDIAVRDYHWPGSQVILAGSPAMKNYTAQVFVAAGAPLDQLSFDPPR